MSVHLTVTNIGSTNLKRFVSSTESCRSLAYIVVYNSEHLWLYLFIYFLLLSFLDWKSVHGLGGVDVTACNFESLYYYMVCALDVGVTDGSSMDQIEAVKIIRCLFDMKRL